MEPERNLTGLLNARARKQRIPLSGTFELSPVCNLACRMCYVRKTPAEVAAHFRPMMTLDRWKALGDQAAEAGMLFLLLTGGEPFLWPDFRELYEYLQKRGLILSVNTNGTLLDENTVAWLRTHPPGRINVTLYGACDETYRRLCGGTGMFTRVAQGIDRLRSAGIHVKLNCSLTPENAEDLEQIVEFAKQRDLLLGVNTYMYPPVRRDESLIGRGERFTPEEAAAYRLQVQKLTLSPERYDRFLQQAAQGLQPPPGLDESCVDPVDGTVRCQAGYGAFWVTWDGQLTPCGMLTAPAVDLYEVPFAQAWQQLTGQMDDIRLSGLCAGCENRKLCHPCLATAVTETGSPAGVPRYLCRMAEALRTQASQKRNEIKRSEK